MQQQSPPTNRPLDYELNTWQRMRRDVIRLLLAFLLLGAGFWVVDSGDSYVRAALWLLDPAARSAWTVTAGERCGDAPLLIPSTGYVGFGWDDAFYPGHHHSGIDVFGPDGRDGVTPVVAAYAGYLTREENWRSSVILRHPDLLPDEEVWTYYTHMASRNGRTSYVDEAFPVGTVEMFVEAGTLLGYQGTWSGGWWRPMGRHLHFSVVRSTAEGGYANEQEIDNTLNPLPLLGLVEDERGIVRCAEE